MAEVIVDARQFALEANQAPLNAEELIYRRMAEVMLASEKDDERMAALAAGLYCVINLSHMQNRMDRNRRFALPDEPT